MIDLKDKEWIDDAPYIALLRKWRHARAGDPMFRDELGDYYAEVMVQKRNELSRDQQVAISKAVGWD